MNNNITQTREMMKSDDRIDRGNKHHPKVCEQKVSFGCICHLVGDEKIVWRL